MYCKQCGKQQMGNERFCGGCGFQCASQMDNGGHMGGTMGNNWGNGGQPQQFQDDPNNTMALIGLILAFFFPTFGLICSIIGLVKAKELNGKGRGMAIAGLIISIVMFVLSIILTVLMFSVWSDWVNDIMNNGDNWGQHPGW